MAYGQSKWVLRDLSQAMANAVFKHAHPRFIRENGDCLKFNGFWRNGDKQNVCLRRNNATWHDAKTGEGGGCKDFAKTAFHMTLPDFMRQFGNNTSAHMMGETIDIRKIFSEIDRTLPNKPINLIWSQINNTAPDNLAITWLEGERGFKNVSDIWVADLDAYRIRIFAILNLFTTIFLNAEFLRNLDLMVPLRSTHSDEVKNILFRTISHCDKDAKARLLPNVGGWHEPDGSPRAFGFPHLIIDFPHLVLCEGMADYFAAECLLKHDEDFLPIGVANADALIQWAKWLVDNRYSGGTTIVYQLDKDKEEISLKKPSVH